MFSENGGVELKMRKQNGKLAHGQFCREIEVDSWHRGQKRSLTESGQINEHVMSSDVLSVLGQNAAVHSIQLVHI